VPDPLLTAGVVALVLPWSDDVSGGGPTPPSDGRWGFPVHEWRGYAPTRSQEYRAGDHNGLDIMFRRRPGGADQMWPKGTSGTGDARRSYGTDRWFFPDAIYACAMRDGTVFSTGKGGHGRFLVLDHGKPFATFYTHLSSMIVTKGERVTRGQPLGVIGYSTIDAARLMHLHCEIWYRGGSKSHVDPWPLLERAPLPPVPPGAHR
jgi:hypothetical protein